ncbi:MAG: TetR/AcrR family transcriptional regulator [Bacteroidota bacterium]|nr:TetR/AcrR family transcriptional regulator [Bacteroidota bacterium]
MYHYQDRKKRVFKRLILKIRSMLTERQEEIIETAIELIDSKGIQGLTIKNLSKKIGISEPAIYRHFDSKIHILTTVLEMLKKGSENVYNVKIAKNENAVEKITNLFESHFKMFTEKPVFASVIFSEELFQNETVLKAKVAEVINHNNEILISIIQTGQKKNEIRKDIKADDLAILIMGTLRLYVKKWQLSGLSFNLKQEGARIIEMIKTLIEKK